MGTWVVVSQKQGGKKKLSVGFLKAKIVDNFDLHTAVIICQVDFAS